MEKARSLLQNFGLGKCETADKFWLVRRLCLLLSEYPGRETDTGSKLLMRRRPGVAPAYLKARFPFAIIDLSIKGERGPQRRLRQGIFYGERYERMEELES